jgi:hypothetical protein
VFALQNAEGEDALAYHWHPQSISRVTWPHLHVGVVGHPFMSARTHVPTGNVALADVVRLAIEAFDVSPRRADWRTVL